MKNNQSSKPKSAAILLGILFLLIIFSLLFKRFKEIRTASFSRIFRTNIVIIDKNGSVGLFSLTPQSSFFLRFPDDYPVKATRGYGDFSLGEVFKLSSELGGQLVKESIQENFSIPVYGYIVLDQPFEKIEDYRKWIKRVLFDSFGEKTKTDFNKEDLLVLSKKIFFNNKRLFSEKEFNGLPFDEAFNDQKLREERLSIEILNSTSHDGLAKKISKLLENIGGRVIRLADYEPILENCQILINNKETVDSYTVGVLSASTGCWVGKRGREENRADITVIIGEDYWKKLNEKW